MADTLDALRQTIANLDRQLLELLRRRLVLADEVGRLRAEAEPPVTDIGAQQILLAANRRHAETLGVSEQTLAAFVAAVNQAAGEREDVASRRARTRHGQRVLIVGGAGAMGGWFSSFLSRVGYRVDALDPAWRRLPASAGLLASLNEVEDFDAFDFIVVSTPLALTPHVVEEVAAHRPRGLIVELSSIKSPVLPALQAARGAGLKVCALHPMFGPGKSVFEPLTFVIACLDDREAERARVEPLLRHPRAHVIAVPFEEHDRVMAWVLCLAHLCAIAFGATLTRSGLEPRLLHSMASTTFARQVATAASVLGENADLYLDIQRTNPHRAEVFRALHGALEQLVDVIEKNDKEAFRTLLTTARRLIVPEEDGSSR